MKYKCYFNTGFYKFSACTSDCVIYCYKSVNPHFIFAVCNSCSEEPSIQTLLSSMVKMYIKSMFPFTDINIKFQSIM